MSRFLCALYLMVFLPIAANAASTSSIANTNCSGSLTSSLLNGASFACAGNLTLDGGFVTSDSLINISATGDLFLDNLTFTAPNVTFSVLSGMMTIGSGVVINSNSIILAGDTGITVAQGALINILPGSNNNVGAGTGFPLGGGGLTLSAGGALSSGAGGGLNLGAGSGGILGLGGNLPVAGGTLVVGSGGLISLGSSGGGTLFSVTSVPEPASYAMMLAGILGLISFRRRV